MAFNPDQPVLPPPEAGDEEIAGFLRHRRKHARQLPVEAEPGDEEADAFLRHRTKHTIPVEPQTPGSFGPNPMDRFYAWQKAIQVVDASEVLCRDLIERELAGIAGLDHVTIAAANAVTKRLMLQVGNLRTKSLKAAFRLIRDRLGDEPIQGRPLGDWAAYFIREDLKAIDNAIRTGLIHGLNNTDIARKVVGSMGLNGVDGCTEYVRHRIAHLGVSDIKDRPRMARTNN